MPRRYEDWLRQRLGPPSAFQAHLIQHILLRLNPEVVWGLFLVSFGSQQIRQYFVLPSTNTHGVENLPLYIFTALSFADDLVKLYRLSAITLFWLHGWIPTPILAHDAVLTLAPLACVLLASALALDSSYWLLGQSHHTPTLARILGRLAAGWLFVQVYQMVVKILAILLGGNQSDPNLLRPLWFTVRTLLKSTTRGASFWQVIELVGLADGDVLRNEEVIKRHEINAQRDCRRNALKQSHAQPRGMPSYAYKPLPGDGWIRLVRVISRGPSQPPCFSLINARLDAGSQFHAISYMWGDPRQLPTPPPLYGLEVDGAWLRVTRATFEVLYGHASAWADEEGRDVLFWIDALCINQQDEVEKSSQIKIMAQIYSQASSVVSFLRPRNNIDADVVAHVLSTTAANIRCADPNPATTFLTRMGTNIISLFGIGAQGKAWEKLSRVLGHEYWERMWIVQEVSLSTRLRIYYGDRKLDWRDLLTIADPSTEQREHPDFAVSKLMLGTVFEERKREVLRTLKLMIRRRAGRNFTAPELFTSVTQMKATDPRDRIWALRSVLPELGGLPWPQSMEPQPDMRLRELYENTARFFIKSIDPEWLLCLAGLGYSVAGEPSDLARSWIPDWGIPRPKPLPSLRARLTLHPSDGSTLKFTVKGTSLRVSGCSLLGRIAHTTSVSSIYAQSEPQDSVSTIYGGTLRRNRDSLRQMSNLMESLERYAKYDSVSELIDALGNTVTGGQISTAPADVVRSFRDFFLYWQRQRSRLRRLATTPDPTGYMGPGRLLLEGASPAEAPGTTANGNVLPALTNVCDQRLLAFTERGKLALVPKYVEVGDSIYSFRGAGSFFVVREGGPRGHALVGDCYLHGAVPAQAVESVVLKF